MNAIPEQYAAFSKQNLEAALHFANVALEGTERILEVQLNAAKRALTDNTKNARALANVNDAKELADVQTAIARPAFESALEYSRNVYQIASETQNELSKLFGQQAAEFSRGVISLLDKAVSSAPAGSDFAVAAMRTAIAAANTAYGAASRSTRQATEALESNNVSTGGKRKTA